MYLCKNYNAMKRIHLTKDEKQLLWRIQAGRPECPDTMPHATFVYTIIQLQDKDLIKATFALGKIKEAKLTNWGRFYMDINPQLRNPFPWKIIFDISTIIAAIAATAALFVRLLHM